MPLDQIIKSYATEMEGVEKEIQSSIIGKDGLISQISGHVLNSGGKRIRPLLLVIASHMCNYRGYYNIILGSVVELIHTATLLHDDVVDHADIRRGRNAARTIWGNRSSILVGDYVFISSMEKAFSLNIKDIDNLVIATCKKLVEGEILQLFHNGNIELNEDIYFKILSCKTAELIGAACKMGGIISNASPEKNTALQNFGAAVGIAFQVADDALDYISDKDTLGKSMGKDLAEGKLTLPLLHLLKKCNAKEKTDIKHIIQIGDFNLDNLIYIQTLMKQYESISYSMIRARKYVEKAKSHLSLFEDSEDRQALFALADFFINRDY